MDKPQSAASRWRETPRSVAPRRYRSTRKTVGRLLPYLAILPAVITFLVLLGYPVLLVVETSFQHFGLRELINGGQTWVGPANYQKIVGDPEFISVVIRTFLFMAANVALTIVVGTLIALLLDKLNGKVRLLLSISMVLAWATPAVTGSVIFQWLFDSKLGIANWAISNLGIFGDWLNHSWFDTGLSTFAIITMLIVWQSVPFVAFSLYAGIISISKDLFEAARVDGASEWQLFWHIILPAIRPLVLVLTFLSIIWDFKVFTQIYTMLQGGPDGQTITLSIYAYIKGLSERQFGIAAAVSVVMVLLLLLVLVPYIRHMTRSQVEQ
jgi:N,N'-diacetylchitobiose transport system permease protein